MFRDQHIHTIRANRLRQARVEKIYDRIARMCLKYGHIGNTSGVKSLRHKIHTIEDHIKEFWPEEDRPSVEYVRNKMNMKTLRWYIHNKISINEDIWTPDFLFGLSKNGHIKWSKKKFPSLRWYMNENLLKVVSSSPFGGRIIRACNKKFRFDIWSCVPAFYLKHSEESIGFMAGLLSGGKSVNINGVDYARYLGRATAYIDQWGIPIESRDNFRRHVFISPIWPALFSLKMPKEIAEVWTSVDNPCNANIYCPILWRTYVGSFLKDTKGCIPYIPSRRSIFYQHKCEEGAIKRLEGLRISTGMINLDYRIRDMVKIWKDKSNESV